VAADGQVTPGPRTRASPGRLVIASNRGPTEFFWQEGAWQTRPATSALTIMLEPLVRDSETAWYCCAPEPPEAVGARGMLSAAARRSGSSLDIVPVPVAEKTYDAYYGRVANEVLWMLQHDTLRAAADGSLDLDAELREAWTAGYERANTQVAAAIAASVTGAAAFLVHDYHLYLLPRLLRRTFDEVPILHYTHIPFPSASTLRRLPLRWWRRILLGLLGADVVGFQVESDARAFLECCASLDRTSVDSNEMTVQTTDRRRVRVRAFPASVDPAELRRTMRSSGTARARRQLAGYWTGPTIVRVDRLDPSKNQVTGFEAFSKLLEQRRDLRGRVRFLAFLVPSRTGLGRYEGYRRSLYETVQAINERFAGAYVQPPIEVFYVNDRELALVAMESCDVLLANSIADGMNLVAKEWAVVSKKPGALVVSERAGVSREAAGAALPVSPFDLMGTASALGRALDMTPEERAVRLTRFRRRIESWTARDWLRAQLDELQVRPGAVPAAEMRGDGPGGDRIGMDG
jgi:trehalose 6-phosphate synthase